MTDFLYSLYLAWKTNNSNTCTCQKVVRSSLVGTVPHSHSLCLHSLCDHIYNTFVLRLTRGVPHAISFKVKKIDNKIFNLYFDFFCYVFYRWYAERQLFVWLEFASIRQRKKKGNRIEKVSLWQTERFSWLFLSAIQLQKFAVWECFCDKQMFVASCEPDPVQVAGVFLSCTPQYTWYTCTTRTLGTW